MGIIQKDFMLQNETARHLYHTYAEGQPIIDYHCHLVPEMIAKDYRFKNATELFLGGDHYKWRQMRTAGIPEELITGTGDDFAKFEAYASIMPGLIGNPLYAFTALELKRYFDVEEPLTRESAARIYAACNERLADSAYSARNLILRSGVEVVCTTDDPIDALSFHSQLREEGYGVRVLPTFRPDKALAVEKDSFALYLRSAGVSTYEELLAWLSSRVRFFAENGCRLSDHSLERVAYVEGDPHVAFERAMHRETPSTAEADAYRTALLLFLAGEYEKHHMAMQLHIGAMRNNNRKMLSAIGPDTGFDSINDFRIAEGISRLLDKMNSEGVLPKTILYNLNPKDNYVLGTMIGNFQSAPRPFAMQFGAGWWFNDNRDGMEAQLRALGNLGMLSGFIGMLTDSRSLVSYPRHEYFRRILCNLLGKWVEDGEYPMDEAALGAMVRGIAYENAKRYFDL